MATLYLGLLDQWDIRSFIHSWLKRLLLFFQAPCLRFRIPSSKEASLSELELGTLVVIAAGALTELLLDEAGSLHLAFCRLFEQ